MICLVYKLFNLFKIIFARTIREVSSARQGEFKLFRIPKEKWEKHGPNTEKTFLTILSEAKSRILEFNSLLSQEVKKGKISSKIIKEDNTTAAKKLKYDLIITSPPYGDSRTTVAMDNFLDMP